MIVPQPFHLESWGMGQQTRVLVHSGPRLIWAPTSSFTSTLGFLGYIMALSRPASTRTELGASRAQVAIDQLQIPPPLCLEKLLKSRTELRPSPRLHSASPQSLVSNTHTPLDSFTLPYTRLHSQARMGKSKMDDAAAERISRARGKDVSHSQLLFSPSETKKH